MAKHEDVIGLLVGFAHNSMPLLPAGPPEESKT